MYLCAASPDESGEEALDWCLESLAQDGDEVIVFRGLEEEAMEKDHDILRANARALMKNIQERAEKADPERKVSSRVPRSEFLAYPCSALPYLGVCSW